MRLYRHGDLLVASTPSLPAGGKKLHHLVLAEGELTGHSHRITEKEGATLYQAGGQLYLTVTAPTVTLVHQEHGPISLTRGTYRVWRQREYSPREIRVIRD